MLFRARLAAYSDASVCWSYPMPSIRALVLSGLLLSLLAACNTVQGVGRYIESVGRAGNGAMH